MTVSARRLSDIFEMRFGQKDSDKNKISGSGIQKFDTYIFFDNFRVRRAEIQIKSKSVEWTKDYSKSSRGTVIMIVAGMPSLEYQL